jgi:hypothetical protein
LANPQACLLNNFGDGDFIVYAVADYLVMALMCIF